MDKIIIKGLEVFAHHGVFKEEKFLGQKFIIDIFLSLNLKIASKEDDLSKSVNYGQIANEVTKVLQDNTFDLIETAADEVIKHILLNHPQIKKCKVTLKKPFAPIGKSVEYAAVSLERSRHEVYLSIGSNMGDRKFNLDESIKKINDCIGIKVDKISSFIETEPWGYENQDKFLNCAVKITTILEIEELMSILLSIEKEMKRVRKIKWGPRIIDLDIVFFDDMVSSGDFVTVPHPRMEEREFVLKPLCEIAPNFIHPLLNKRISRILEDNKL